MAPRETEDNAYANFWGDKQRALCYGIFWSGQLDTHGPSLYPASRGPSIFLERVSARRVTSLWLFYYSEGWSESLS